MATQEEIRQKYTLLQPHLKGRLRRLWAAAEAAAIGRGGIKLVAEAIGLGSASISAGVRELHGHEPPRRRAPRRKRGPKFSEDKDPALLADLERLLAAEVAGDPMSEEKWVRSSTRKLSARLKEQGHNVGRCTVHRLLKKMGFALRGCKRRRGGSKCPGRDEQFQFIASQKKAFSGVGLPVISVDTKKKELIGPFRNPGKTWARTPVEVNDRDFTSAAEYRAVPFGIYDVARNEGHITVGVSNDTPEFAVRAIARWWEAKGRALYPGAGKLLILADCGGTNGHRCRAWKVQVQDQLCNRFGLTVTVCHYPPGCSKWNPIEHRLFSQISLNWAGKPLRSLSIMLAYIRGTTTATGLKVTAELDDGVYRKGQEVTREDMGRVCVKPHSTHPRWNYTLSPAQPPDT
jgi:hypothetical protein